MTRATREQRKKDRIAKNRAFEEKQTRKAKRAMLFGPLIFVLFGFFALYLFTIRPLISIMTTGDWVKGKCVIITSEEKSVNNGSSSGTSRINIIFTYDYEGKTYTSNRYNFQTGSSSSNKQNVVSQYKVGKSYPCYINPHSPQEAVINKGVYKDLWFGLLPGTFILIGCLGLYAYYRVYIRKSDDIVMSKHRLNCKGILLIGSKNRFFPFLLFFLLALIWNGVVGLLMAPNMMRAEMIGFLIICIFISIGVLFIYYAFIHFLRIIAPTVDLCINTKKIILGQEFTLKVVSNDRFNLIDDVYISIQAEELDIERRTNGSSHIERNLIFENVIVDSANSLDYNDQTFKVLLPNKLERWFKSTKKRKSQLCFQIKVVEIVRFLPDTDTYHSLYVSNPN